MEKVTLNLLEIGGKARSKYELYIYTHLWRTPIPPSVQAFQCRLHGWYIRRKEKGMFPSSPYQNYFQMQALDSKYVVVRSISHFLGPRTSDMLEFLIHDCDSEHYMPPKYDQIVLNREWIGNLCKCFCCSFSGNSIHP